MYNLKEILPKRPQNGHKGTFGNVLNIAGSNFYTGAAYFSSIAPLKVGCGKSTLASSKDVLKSVASLSPDIILTPIEKINKNNITDFQAISIGCGLSQEKSSINFFKKILTLVKDLGTPIVIDADGLNILSKLKNIKLPKNTILTPHPKEFSRLMGGISVEKVLEQPEFWIKQCCEKYNSTVILKLHKTIVADNKGHFYENTTGNTALAHGGSGDVLTGMITGLLSQNKKSEIFDICCLAVYLHGLTGELASKDLTEYSVLASDLISYIPKAIKSIL